MPTYYVFIPNYQVTAEVDATNSKHARTAYLDYLTRNQLVPWKGRQAIRKSVKVARSEPGQSKVSVHLDYDMGFSHQTKEEEVSLQGEQPQEQQVEQQYQEGPPQEATPPEERSISPIMDLSRRKFGF
jgi:hypothetical protein